MAEELASKLLDSVIEEMKAIASKASRVEITVDRDFDEPISIDTDLDALSEDKLWRYLHLVMSIAYAFDSLRDRVYQKLREVGNVKEIRDLEQAVKGEESSEDEDDVIL